MRGPFRKRRNDHDIHGAARELVLRLRADGADEWATAIEDAVLGGATGTEILVTLGARLHSLTKAQLTLRASTRERANRLERDIRRSLRGSV